MTESITTREQKLAINSFTSAASLEEVSFYFNLPKEVRGLSILDIGAGCSSAVVELRKQGSTAFTVDY
ncbi:MAG: hypothetical protein V1808_03650 [Candidatus Daviesbacteria bacterium]